MRNGTPPEFLIASLAIGLPLVAERIGVCRVWRILNPRRSGKLGRDGSCRSDRQRRERDGRIGARSRHEHT